MDLVDMMREKAFLGREFLTWLWWRSNRDGQIETDSSPIGVSFQANLRLELGEGDALEQVTCKSKAGNDFHEAVAGLRKGKKVDQATLLLLNDDEEYKLTVKGATLELSGIKLPKAMDSDDGGEDDLAISGAALDRAALVGKLMNMMDTMFAKFIEVRVNSKTWAQELGQIQEWAAREGA